MGHAWAFLVQHGLLNAIVYTTVGGFIGRAFAARPLRKLNSLLQDHLDQQKQVTAQLARLERNPHKPEKDTAA